MKVLRRAGNKVKKHHKKYTNWGVVALVGLLMFGLGQAFGSGRIKLTHSQVASNKSLPANLDYSTVEAVYDSLKEKFDGKLDQDKLLDGLKSGLVGASGDPYTEYMSPKEAKEFSDELDGSFEGIGAQLGKENDYVIIVAPISGTPAEKAGLRPKDIIEKIDGESALKMSIEEARNKIRGKKGTTVKLTVVRGSEELNMDIVRDTISIPSVDHKILDGNIGYMKISQFSADTSGLAAKAGKEFKAANVKGVVLDLRGDPGGYLDAAVNVSSLWLDNKTVLTERRDGVIIRTYNSEGDDPLKGIPTVVLIDEGSASASEITAGALKDNNAASLIGVKSFGKGSVQQPQDLPNGGILKVTIARWFTPNGKNIDKEGLQPDQKVDRTVDDFKNNRDPQLDAALVKLKG